MVKTDNIPVELAREIRMHNKKYVVEIMILAYFVLFIIKYEDVFAAMQHVAIGVASALCCIAFYNRYLKTQTRWNFFVYDSLSDCMKYHGFPVDEYFGFLLKKYLPIQTIMTLVTEVAAFLRKDSQMAVVGVVVFLIPFVIWMLEKGTFQYEISHQIKLWMKIGRAFLEFICTTLSFYLIGLGIGGMIVRLKEFVWMII